MTITAYRIAKAAHAASMWSGRGASDFGGRWNSKGVTVIYTAENRSLAAMEQLVHLIQPRVLRGYVIASIAFDSAQVRRLNPSDLPKAWNHAVVLASLKRYGDEWSANGKFAVLAVPSAVVAGEWNFLINPRHPDFKAMKRSRPQPFVYERRLK